MAERGWLDVPGGRLYYEADGAGPAVVLIHAGIANLRMWDPHVPALAERHRVIRYDTRGFGQTETDHVDFTNRADVAAVLDYLGEASAHVVGASRGGSIALAFAVEWPARVRSLAVVAGGVDGFDPQLSPLERAAADEMAKASEEAWNAKDWMRLADLETAYWVDGPGQPLSRVDPVLRARVHDWILTTYQAEKEEGIPQHVSPPVADRLGVLTMPLLVVIGELDDPETNASCRFLASQVPGARLEVFEGAAHMLNLEQPERFAGLLVDFLAAAEARS